MHSFHARGNPNGSTTSFASSGASSHQSGKYGSSSTMRSDYSAESQQGLFPPLPPTMPPPQTPDLPKPELSIMNRRAGADSSLYQICMNLRSRLATVPGFEGHIAEMAEEEAETGDSIDPVTLMWNSLRRGYPLMTVYNALRPVKPLDVDVSRIKEKDLGKAATFKFLQACLTELKFLPSECFLITDLYGEDTTGFVKVTKVVNKVLDILKEKKLLHYKGPTRSIPSDSIPQTLSKRQHIIEEIVKTERDYVQHLEMLQHFQNGVQTSGAIPGDAVHDIFLNLNALLDFQRRFLIRIEQQNSLPEVEQNWGKLFSHYKDSFRVYEPFIANQNRCSNTVLAKWNELQRATISRELQGMVETPAILLGFLIKPFQRLSKYPLLLLDLEKEGDYDEVHLADLTEGRAAAQSILSRADEALDKEFRVAAVNELQSRVEDWKGHKIEHFGDLLLFGSYTVLKGEGAKEVEREVSAAHSFLGTQSRDLVRDPPQDALLPKAQRKPKCPQGLKPVVDRIPRDIRLSDVSIVIEEYTRDQGNPAITTHGLNERKDKARKRLEDEGVILKSPQASQPQTSRASNETPQHPGPETPIKSPRSTSLERAVSQISYSSEPDLKGLVALGLLAPSSPTVGNGSTQPQRLSISNGPFTRSKCFIANDIEHIPCPSLLPECQSPRTLYFWFPRKRLKTANPISFTKLEKEVIKELNIDLPRRKQYKVYLFERILLCCKEINPNKPKNKMLGANKPLVDKKGKLKLQLKGRIFMQNVTDVVTVKRADSQSYTIQIFWKGDPGVENFVIRFNDEASMKKWQEAVQRQKKILTESNRGSGQTGTSTTEFEYLKSQPAVSNPYREDDVDDDDTYSNQVTGQNHSQFAVSRNASSNSLRSISGQPSRMAPPKIPLQDHGNGVYGASLSLNTNVPPAGVSPGEFAGNSYFSPSNDSPVSIRSSHQQSMFQFQKAQTSVGGNNWTEGDKHRTAPAMGRAPSREGPGPPNSYVINGRTVTRPSLPVMGPSQYPQQQQLTAAQSRLRSASTPDIHNPNAPGARRPGNENVPVPPIPAHMTQMRAPLNRSQTSSPVDGQLPIRSANQSPSAPRTRHHQDQSSYNQHGHRLPPTSEPFIDSPINLSQSSSMDSTETGNDNGIPYPSQLKVIIWFDPAPSRVTIVVPIIIKHRSLIDRIDSKMVKISPASIARGTARLRYRDSDGDLLTITSDEDVQLSIEDWGTSKEDQLRDGIVPDFQLYWQQN